MKIKYGVFSLLFALVILISGVYSFQNYAAQRNMLMKGIDEKLYTAAMMARATLPEDYHDNIVDSSSVSKEEFDGIVDRYNQLCVELDMEYLWSLMIINGEIVFTSSTSPDKNVANQLHAKFFEVHSNPELYQEVFTTLEPQYQINIDKWGEIRVVLIPFTDSQGRPYLFGASMNLSEVEKLLRKNLNKSIFLGLGFLVVGFVLSLLFANFLSKPFHKLTKETGEIASGQLDKKVRVGGFYEQAALAESINRMSLAIKEKINALQMSEENLRTTLNSIGDAVIATDTGGNITGMNPVAEKLTNWKMEEARGKPLTQVFNIVNTRTEEPVPNPASKVLESGQIVSLANHTLLIAKDGTEYQIADSAAPIRDDNGNITGVILVFRDVTEEYQIREALRASEEKYRKLFNTMLDGFAVHKMIYDEDGEPVDYIFLGVNPGFEKMTGLRGTAIIGKTALEVLPDLEKAWITAYGKVTTTGKPVRFTNYSRSLDKWFEVFVYRPETGQFATIFTDVTERKKTEEIALDSQKMAGIGRLAAGMAHEINSPLQMVTGISERLTRKVNAGEIDAGQFLTDLGRINKSGWRIANIVRSLLTYSRQTAPMLASHYLNELVEETLFMIEHQLRSWSNIAVIKELAEDMPAVNCDSNNFTQVILNLLENAKDAMPAGGEITIRTAFEEAEKQFVLTIHNTGEPIPEDIQSKIFEPFFTTKEVGKGTGLGLSIIHGIITAHGGKIAVESAPGIGTAFIINLPQQPNPEPPPFEADRGEGRY